MRLLLGSGGFGTPERRDLLLEQTADHFAGVDQILFIPYALADHDAYTAWMRERGLDAGVELVGIHTCPDPVAAVESAQAISVGGGNTFRLTADLHRLGLIEPVRRRVLEHGVPYMGVSAGSNVACPTMQTTNDMPITMPASFETFNLVPFQINAHYFTGNFHYKTDAGFIEHFGETRDDRIREYHEMNDRPVIGLAEGGILRIDDQRVRLLGAPARLFRKGQEPIDIAPPAQIEL